MAWHLTDEDVGQRWMQVDATLRAVYQEPIYDDEHEPPEWYIGEGATGGGIKVMLGGCHAVQIEPFLQFSAPGWQVVWREGHPVTGTRRARVFYGSQLDVTIRAEGTMKRYEEISGFWSGVSDLLPSCLRNVARKIKDHVESYHFTLSLGGTVTYEWDWPSDVTWDGRESVGLAGVQSDIVIQTIARRPYVYEHEFEEDIDTEEFVPDGVINLEACNTLSNVWVEGTYSRSPGGVCEEARFYSHRHWGEVGVDVQYGPPDSTVEMYAEASMGNGAFCSRGGIGLGNTANNTVFSQASELYLHDTMGEYTVVYDAVDVKNLDGADRADDTTIITSERHPRLIETLIGEENFVEGDSYNYNGETDPALISTRSYVWTLEDDTTPIPGLEYTATAPLEVTYKGRLYTNVMLPIDPVGSPVAMTDTMETFVDLNADLLPEPAQLHHGNLIIDGIAPGTPAEGAMKEPAHPPWLPTEGLDPYFDNVALCDAAAAANRLTLADALKITLAAAPGELVPNPPLIFGETGQTWDDTNCTATPDGTALTINTGESVEGAEASCTNIVALNKHVRGARDLVITWTAPEGAEAVLHLGESSWNLVSDGSGASVIDVCRPDTCTVTADPTMQSLVSYELQGSFDFPAGFGIGRLTALTIEPKTPDTIYVFTQAQFRRRSTAEGGFAKLYVIPLSPWNDTWAPDDFSWFAASGGWIVPKAHLVIDGVAVLEIPLASISSEAWPTWFKLSDDVFAYPQDDYSTPTAIPVNGVTVEAGTIPEGLWAENCLTGFLEGGVYEADESNEISVDLVIRPRYWTICQDVAVLPTTAYQRFRGVVQGLLFADDEPAGNTTVTIGTPNASPGAEEIQAKSTNGIGWFESDALNTKGAAEIETAGLPATEVALRNRMWSRIVCETPHLALRYCAPTGKIVVNQNGNPALTCCE